MKPSFEFTSFRDTLIEIKDNKESLLQEIILSQFSMDNQKIYCDNYDIKDTLGVYQN